jgi:hypothetical protein
MRLVLITLIGLLAAAPAALAAPHNAPFTLFPVVGGATYTDDFGDPRGSGVHEGNDLMAPCGTPVIAVVDGTIRLDWGSRSGWMVTLVGSGSWYRYIHMGVAGDASSALVKGLRNGALVKEGQVVSYVGRTGDAKHAPCHLHFELHYGQPAVSPFQWLQRATIVQANPNDPAMTTEANQVTLTIQGTVAWAATYGDAGRLVIRPTAVRTSAGETIDRRGAIALRAAIELVGQVRPGARVTVTTTPMPVTSELLQLKPLSWTAAAVA